MNVPLCLMLLRRRRISDITVMFHEVAYPISRGQSLRHNALGVVHRAMAAMLARSASRIFVAAQAWTASLRRLVPAGREFNWLPVPSTIPVVRDRAATLAARSRFAMSDGRLLGHFGTYGPLVAARLNPALHAILSTQTDTPVLLIGRNSERFRDAFVRDHPAHSSRVFATGPLPESDVSIHIGACDVMLQPFPDGITSRNTSALAGLAHGKATATTAGRFSETSGTAAEPCRSPPTRTRTHWRARRLPCSTIATAQKRSDVPRSNCTATSSTSNTRSPRCGEPDAHRAR